MINDNYIIYTKRVHSPRRMERMFKHDPHNPQLISYSIFSHMYLENSTQKNTRRTPQSIYSLDTHIMKHVVKKSKEILCWKSQWIVFRTHLLIAAISHTNQGLIESEEFSGNTTPFNGKNQIIKLACSYYINQATRQSTDVPFFVFIKKFNNSYNSHFCSDHFSGFPKAIVEILIRSQIPITTPQ